MRQSLARRVVAEVLGTFFLLAVVVASGVMGERLANGNAALALLANTAATVAALVALIISFAPVSGAHFNPVVTLSFALRHDVVWREVPFYMLAPLVGGTFAGIRPSDVPGFVLAQLAGGIAATMLFGWLTPAQRGDRNEQDR